MTTTPDLPNPAMVRHCLRNSADDATPAELLRRLAAAGLDRIPLPGRGNTLLRWRMLAAVAAHDLATVKLYEGHTDALAILAELGADEPPSGSLWGVWCAEAPGARLAVEHAAGTVMHEVGQALGAGPFCRSRRFARLIADLPVFLRQSHARRDQAALGTLAHERQDGWAL